MQQVNFVCRQEKCKIGHIEISDGQQVVITSRGLSSSFVPEREEFRLFQSPKTGQVFKCPRCGGWVHVEGDESLMTPIILGNTVLSAQSQLADR